MLKLRTVFSYWLNDRLRDEFVKEDTRVLVGFKFPTFLRISARISQRPVHKLKTFFSPDIFLNNFKFYIQSKLSKFPIKNNDRKRKLKIVEYTAPWSTILGMDKLGILILALLCHVDQSNRYYITLILN